MYFFIKKTDELVKKKKAPVDKLSLQKKNGAYVTILIGKRKDKSFFIFENQLKKVEVNTPLSNFELLCLKEARQDTEKWRDTCSCIKSSRGNNYPKDWIQILRKENLMNDVEVEKNNTGINLISMMNGLFKSMSNTATEENPAVSNVPTIILLETDSENFGKKKADSMKKVIESDKIIFESKFEGASESSSNIDFISRFHIKNLIVKEVNILKNSSFTFLKPFNQNPIQNNFDIKNTLELYEWIYNTIYQKHIHIVENNVEFDDIGIDFIKINKNNNYSIHFFYS